MNNIKVSVLVPVYRAEKFIERCARSLFDQTYDNLEFVFVNDCTPDGSIDILKHVLDDYPERQSQTKIVNHKKNRGVAAARNTLLDNATGDYLLWVDADDFIAKNAAEVLVANAIETNADIVCFGTAVYSVSGIKTLPLIEETSSESFIADMLADRTPTTLWGKMLHRSILTDNNITFIDGLDIGEDMLLLVKAVYFSQTISFVQKVLYYYDDTSDQSLVRSFSIEKNVMLMKILKNLAEFLDGKLDMKKYLDERFLDVQLLIVYGTCLNNDKRNYEFARSRLSRMDCRNIRNRRSSFYLFFLHCNNYTVNRLWAKFMLLLKNCVVLKKSVLKKIKRM